MMLSTFANSSSPSKNALLSNTPSKAAVGFLSHSPSLSTATTVVSESPNSTKAAHHRLQSRKHKQQDGDLSSDFILSMTPPSLYPIVHEIDDDVTAFAPQSLGTKRSVSEPGDDAYYINGRFEDSYVLTRLVSSVAAAIECWYTTCY